MAEELMDVLDELDDLEEDDSQKGMFMTFRIGDECYGIAIEYVNEIISTQVITPVPEVEDYIKGLINIRGKIIPVIDVKIRFKQEPFEYMDRTCIIVIDVKGTMVGLIVEQIADVITIDEKDIIPPPSLKKPVTHHTQCQNQQENNPKSYIQPCSYFYIFHFSYPPSYIHLLQTLFHCSRIFITDKFFRA